MKSWINQQIGNMTIEDAMDAHSEGINLVCGDGRLQQVTMDAFSCPSQRVLDVIRGKEA